MSSYSWDIDHINAGPVGDQSVASKRDLGLKGLGCKA